MKKIRLKIFISFILALIYLTVAGQTKDSYNIPLSNPGDDGKLIVHIMQGSVVVEGYSGNEVVVESTGGTIRNHMSHNNGKNSVKSNLMSFTIEEIDNTVRVNHSLEKGLTNYKIKVPFNFSVDLKTMSQGEIIVKNVTGSHEVSNTNGPITMTNVSGSVIADALNQDIEVSFDQVDNSTAMMFTSLNGDLDISFPSNLSALVTALTENGTVYTDFEITSTKNSEDIKISDGIELHKVNKRNGVSGKINDGENEIMFKTLNGDILIREH